MTDPSLRRDTRARLRRQSKRKADQLALNLAAYRFRGPLGQVMRENRFTVQDFELLAILLQATMHAEDPAVEGRLLLGSLFRTSFEVLSGMDLLHESSRLRASGLVILADDEEEPADLLEARFRLSEDALDSFRQEISGLVPEDLRRRRVGPYHHNREFLIDLRILHNLYKHRSERVFHVERWDRLNLGCPEPGIVNRRIQGFWGRMRQRLTRSEGARQFPSLRFFREYGLSEEEMIVVVHLLFKELYEGIAYADTADLLRLISKGEDDLIRNRRLLVAGATLIEREIIQVEPILEGRELTGEVHLSDWVVNLLLGAPTTEPRIRPDERLEWHLYLKNLEDTKAFFKDMESN